MDDARDNDLTSKEAADLALKLADIHLRILQFYITVSALLGGWAVIQGLPPDYVQRGLLIAGFGVTAAAFCLGSWAVLGRANHALKIAQDRSNSDAATELFAKNERCVSVGAMVLVGVGVVALIVTAEQPTTEPTPLTCCVVQTP